MLLSHNCAIEQKLDDISMGMTTPANAEPESMKFKDIIENHKEWTCQFVCEEANGSLFCKARRFNGSSDGPVTSKQ
jgi:hypothetical protein